MVIQFIEYLFGSYSFLLFIIYFALFICAMAAIVKYVRRTKNWDQNKLSQSQLAPGISVIAAAFNESVTIIDNVRSLLTLYYSRFEIIVVDDGSTDDTLDKLISEFNLVEVSDYYVQYKVPCAPILKVFRSRSRSFQRLTIIHKVNGGCKADAVNAGLNIAVFPYILNTDVDSVLSADTLVDLVEPILSSEDRVLAVGATLRMSNSCVVEAGKIETIKLPTNILVRLQEMEYVRAYLLGKMGWSQFNALSNVSGGLGLFDKEILIGSGGYDKNSLGEDMEILIRMCKYACENDLKYSVKYIPKTLCWTEGPDSLRTFARQRVRWARGLSQIMRLHRDVLFNAKYKRLGLLVMPYNLLFELLAPVMELLGLIFIIFMYSVGLINMEMALLVLVMVYSFSVFMTTYSILLDHMIYKYYDSWGEVFKLCLMAWIEPFFYHPIIVYCSLKGYWQEIRGKKHAWGAMPRKGTAKKKIMA
ncbi:glycosyltransferase family 2 protein [Sphingobacterium shayense]|uniref:glycosyltransferase family 2 protein n=1 Tax=Sphingobacterium shayense TaxID=626343 RepID=UPI001552C9B2|nr:glycosyltransferase [Sphingobacterium shayense]NQD71142.1 glycosyltransferase family 2 protein [Sphingobacterium shayense]